MTTIRKICGRLFSELLILIICVYSIIPILYAVLGAFKTSREAAEMKFTLPTQWVTANILNIAGNPDYQRSFFNSIIYVVFGVTITLLVSSMTAYILARRKDRIATFIYYLFICGMIVPWFVIPSIKIMQSFGLMGTYHGMILMYVCMNTPFSIFLMTGFIKGLPKDLDEAACIDGCSPIRTFFSIILPLLKPVSVTLLIWVGVSIWNDLQIGIYFGRNRSYYPVNVWTYFSVSQKITRWENVFACTVIAILPILIVYMLAQKYIISGMTAGAVKQ